MQWRHLATHCVITRCISYRAIKWVILECEILVGQVREWKRVGGRGRRREGEGEREKESWQREDQASLVGSTRSRLSIQQSAALWGSVRDRTSAVCLCENQQKKWEGSGGKGRQAKRRSLKGRNIFADSYQMMSAWVCRQRGSFSRAENSWLHQLGRLPWRARWSVWAFRCQLSSLPHRAAGCSRKKENRWLGFDAYSIERRHTAARHPQVKRAGGLISVAFSLHVLREVDFVLHSAWVVAHSPADFPLFLTATFGCGWEK